MRTVPHLWQFSFHDLILERIRMPTKHRKKMSNRCLFHPFPTKRLLTTE